MRIEVQKKQEAEVLYRKLGITLAQAVNIFISQSLLVGGLPFEVKLPSYNQETENAFKEAKGIASGKIPAAIYDSTDELFEDLERP